jgi:hypothetical protein
MEKPAIISLYSINWLAFIAEMECAHTTVGTESFNITQVNVRLKIINTRQSHINFIYIQLKKI